MNGLDASTAAGIAHWHVCTFQSKGTIMGLTLLPVFVNRIYASSTITIYEWKLLVTFFCYNWKVTNIYNKIQIKDLNLLMKLIEKNEIKWNNKYILIELIS